MSLEPQVYLCSVAFQYGWESDDGVVRGLDLSEEALSESRPADPYGELNIVLTHLSHRIEIGVTDLADDLNAEFTELAGALLACCTSQDAHPGDTYQDFHLRRDGPLLLLWTESWFLPETRTWRSFYDDPSVFSVDLRAFVSSFYEAAYKYHEEISAAIGLQGERAMAPFKAFLQEWEAKTHRALAR